MITVKFYTFSRMSDLNIFVGKAVQRIRKSRSVRSDLKLNSGPVTITVGNLRNSCTSTYT